MGVLEQKVCFITGASRGIGRAVAKRVLEEGGNVFNVSRSAEKIEEFKKEFSSYPIATYCGDVADEKQIIEAFAQCQNELGPVDILINNAGIGLPTPDLSEVDTATFDSMMETNVKGLFLCTREALKTMKEKGEGQIINVVSVAGQNTNPIAPLYCASKFGARGVSSGTADQVLKLGIRVTDVNPGPVDSDYWGDRPVPREKFLKVEDVADVVHYVLTMPAHIVIREINFNSLRYYEGK